MSRYAQGTEVTSDRSRAEIERTLDRYGATSFMFGWDHGRAVVAFIANSRQVRFTLPMPSRDDPDITHTPTKQKRSPSAVERAVDQAVRQRWRALLLVVKAKLEAVDSGIVTFDEEFLAHLVLPDGSTVAEQVLPRVDEAYETGRVPELLPPSRPAIEASA